MPRQRIPDFRCQQCPSIYLSQTGLDNHVEKEHTNQDGSAPKSTTPTLPKYVPRNRSSTLNCTMCNYKYLEQSGLDKHMIKDHNVTPEAGADMTSPMTMVMNRPASGQVNTTYTPRRRTQDFKCQYCPLEAPSIYLTETGLAKHVEKDHHNPPAEPKQDWKAVDITEIFQRSNSNMGSPFMSSPKVENKVVIEKIIPIEEKVIKTPKQGKTPNQRKSKKVKDPNAPKRPLTGYFLFMGDERAKVRASNPDFTVAEIGRELGDRWNSLDAAKKEKYQEQAAKDRARYDLEMKEYSKSLA